MTCHGSLGQLEDCFSIYEIGMDKIASRDRQDGGKLVSLSDCDVAYLVLEGCARVVFDLGV